MQCWNQAVANHSTLPAYPTSWSLSTHLYENQSHVSAIPNSEWMYELQIQFTKNPKGARAPSAPLPCEAMKHGAITFSLSQGSNHRFFHWRKCMIAKTKMISSGGLRQGSRCHYLHFGISKRSWRGFLAHWNWIHKCCSNVSCEWWGWWTGRMHLRAKRERIKWKDLLIKVPSKLRAGKLKFLIRGRTTYPSSYFLMSVKST